MLRKHMRQMHADRVTPRQQAMPDICACDWRYSLSRLNSLLPSALSLPADFRVLCFLSLENCWRSKVLSRAFHFLFVQPKTKL